MGGRGSNRARGHLIRRRLALATGRSFPQKLHFAWRLWHVDWKPAGPGYYTILSRATDTAGRVQPFVPAWNPSGYLWNGIDRIGVTVEAKA